jgi:hypothetical protein
MVLGIFLQLEIIVMMLTALTPQHATDPPVHGYSRKDLLELF